MTPEKKAKELVGKMNFTLSRKETNGYVYLSLKSDSMYYAKYCALEAVEMILRAIDWHSFETPNVEIEYWGKVKEEINKL